MDREERVRRIKAGIERARANRDMNIMKDPERLPERIEEAVFQATLKILSKTVPEVNMTVTINTSDSSVKRPITGVAHAALSRVIKYAALRMNILLVGPAGTGKTHLCRQVSEALGIKFGFISCSFGLTEGQLLGRLLPIGEGGKMQFATTQFVDCYENGGVFLFDEIDGADANTLVVVNSALSNGYLSVPQRPDKPVAYRHKDFVCMAAANTFGNGGNRMYTGRSQLDAATLDRFRACVVNVGYDTGIEKALVDPKLLASARFYREHIENARLRRFISTRFLINASTLISASAASHQEVWDTFFADWSQDERSRLREHTGGPA
jgi:MoxR-like ATPase